MKPHYRRRYTPPARPENPLTPAAVEQLRKIHATCPLCTHEHPDDGEPCESPVRMEGAHIVRCGCRGLLP